MKQGFLFILLLISFSSFSQSHLHCGTDVAMRKFYQAHPGAEQQRKAHLINSVKKRAANSATYTIPVVFHILHLGGPENISDAQVKDALTILNRDFSKHNADTAFIIPEFKLLADSTKIQFALATLDPNGICTNGIIHYYDTDTDWDESSPTLYQYTWDPTRYMNVYVVRTITLSSGFGAAGYTYFPGSFSPGDPMDAIVVLNNYFGSIGTGNSFLSRVMTHEVGHWLGLAHVFGFSNGAGVDCTGDDFISDTPTTQGFLSCPNASDPASYQICTPGISENYQNYMDYSYCVKMFTQEQALSMQFTIQSGVSGRDNLCSAPNLISTGVLNSTITCVPEADFKYNRSKTCVGTPVTFMDASTNATATSYTWTFAGGTPASSNAQNPTVVYNTPGVYSVTYRSASSGGSSTPVTKSNIITVVTNTASYNASFFEGFESNTLPNNDWDVFNTSGGAFWQQSSDASYGGAFSAKLSSVNNTRLAASSMVSPVIDISSLSAPVLNFRLAAAESNTAHINNLKVFASTDCENTWIEIYSKTGSTLVTTGSTMNPFIPSSLSQWRGEVVSLSPVAGSNQVKFKFTYTRDTVAGASNVFIDNINLSNFTGLHPMEEIASFDVFPNPARESVTINRSSHVPATIFITDVLGQVIEIPGEKAGSYTLPVGQNTVFKPGIYFVSMLVNGSLLTKKLVVN